MRGGRLLAEKSPSSLISEFGTSLLEDIMLKICRSSETRCGRGDEDDAVTSSAIATITKESEGQANYDPYANCTTILTAGRNKSPSQWAASWNRVRALVRKNFVVMTRNWM